MTEYSSNYDNVDSNWSKQGMPTAYDLLPYALKAVANAPKESTGYYTDLIVQEIHLPDQLAKARYKTGRHDFVIKKRVSWALSELKNGGLIASDVYQRASYYITSSGRSMLGKALSKNDLINLPTYQEHAKHFKTNKSALSIKHNFKNSFDNEISITTDSNNIDELEKKNYVQIKNKLLDYLYIIDPYKLEHIVVNLLSTMGYKGINADAITTSKSNDGGIDGIINRDILGFDKIYIQVKRYAKGNHVQRPEIDAFLGVINSKNIPSMHSIFVTTSSFSSAAEEVAKLNGIILMNGNQLANYLMQYHIGVSVRTYNFYNIDLNYFK